MTPVQTRPVAPAPVPAHTRSRSELPLRLDVPDLPDAPLPMPEQELSVRRARGAGLWWSRAVRS